MLGARREVGLIADDDGPSSQPPIIATITIQRANSRMQDRDRLASLEGHFAPGEIETFIDQSGISTCGTGGRRGVTVRHRPTGEEVTVDGRGTQVQNKIAALEALIERLG